jgi:hypothetical protein
MVPVSRALFEYEIVPRMGRAYAARLRTCARPHPADPHRLVLIPERVHQVFQSRRPGEPVTSEQLEAMHYPRLPDEDELEKAYAEQRRAALAGDEVALRDLHRKVEALEAQVVAAKQALETWQKADPVKLEERIAWELASAPHADILVGIPAEAV